MNTNINEEIYNCLDRLSNSVGTVINEYHWRELCGLMIMMNSEGLIKEKKPTRPADDTIKYKTNKEDLIKLILSGCKFKYISYDHKKALTDYLTLNEYDEMRRYISRPHSYDMPDILKEKHKVERIGKLRAVFYDPQGKPYKFQIGAKFAKTYFLSDFGINVFPIV